MTDSPENLSGGPEIEAQAAAWVLKHDRGLTAPEQAEHRRWLAANPRHGESFELHRRSWAGLDRLALLKPAGDLPPDPGLLNPSPWRWAVILPLSLAAALVAVLFVWMPGRGRPAADAPRPSAFSLAAGRNALEDGSMVDLSGDGSGEVRFTPGERGVQLRRGEAQFTVAKNPLRPFIVRAGGVAVRAVGTVFVVRLEADSVGVLVTEGRVQVSPPASPAGPGQPPAIVAAGQPWLLLPLVQALPAPPAASAAVAHRLPAPSPPPLDFTARPLSEVVAEFNRHNRVQIVVADADLGALPISLHFRANNPEGFVRLLQADFGVSTERAGDKIILRRR